MATLAGATLAVALPRMALLTMAILTVGLLSAGATARRDHGLHEAAHLLRRKILAATCDAS